MSERDVGAASTAEAIYDAAGNRIGGGRTNPEVEPLVRFAQERPVTTAILALGIGYFLGRLL